MSEELTTGEIPESQLREYFGDSYDAVFKFGELLTEHGIERGLIGPRELPRLWDRHLLNSAAAAPFLPEWGVIVDVGSGAGLPGIVLAAMKPEAHLILVEPMERRCIWLNEVIEELNLENVEVRRGRADEFEGVFEADVVTSRAVAPLVKLAAWSFPLMQVGGKLVALKGRNVEAELAPARKVLHRFRATDATIHSAGTLPALEPTTVLTVTRGK